MLCIVIKGPSLKEAELQLEKASQYADMVELRLDLFSAFSLQDLKQLKEKNKIGG